MVKPKHICNIEKELLHYVYIIIWLDTYVQKLMEVDRKINNTHFLKFNAPITLIGNLTNQNHSNSIDEL